MAYYGIIFPEFWTGQTGRELRAHGKDAQILALYLATNRHANMIGLYRLLLDDIRHETGLGMKALVRGFAGTEQSAFCCFDAGTSYVLVPNMARFRLGLKPGEALDPEDKKVPAVNRIYHALDPNPFLGEFFDANHKLLKLKKRRESIGVVVRLDHPHYMSGLEGASKGLGSQVTESGNRDQDQVQVKSAADEPPLARPSPHENRRVIRELALDVVRRHHDLGFPDLKDLAKQACADCGLTYDAETVGSALEQAIARVNKKAAS